MRYFHRPGHPKANERGMVAETDLGGWDQNNSPLAIHAGIVMDRHYEGIRATDGTDIGSRRKRREWMKANNLADADDFKGVWAKAAKERAEFLAGKKPDPKLRHDLVDSLHRVKSGYRPKVESAERAGYDERDWTR